MHIIIDIRARYPEDAYISRYAINWAKKWKKFAPNDTITFLIFDQQEAPEGENFHRVKPLGWFSSAPKIESTNKNEIFRCLNFSRYAPYDPSIPTLTHIFDMWRWFYDNETNANILRRKEREFEIKKMLKNSAHCIVPSFFTGNELVELWNVHEKNVDIIPMLDMEKISFNENIFMTHNLPRDFFLYDATFGIEANLEIVLKEFWKYIHKKNGKFHLVLHGNSAKNLKFLTENIRQNQLEWYIHITGCLDLESHEALYTYAKAWIFVGGYNTSKTNIALAKSHNLLLILSDIPAFDLYTDALKIHPNHLEELSHIFAKIEKWEKFSLPEPQIFEESAILSKYKILLSENKKFFKK